MPCGQPRLESTVVGMGPNRGASFLDDTTVVEPPYTQSSSSVADQTIVPSSQQVLANLKSLRSDSAQGGQGSPGSEGDKVVQKCRYFLRGTCRHGFSGKVERDGKPGCLFSHPPVCKKYMDQGLKGYSKGSNCELTHVTVCKESLEKKTCSSSLEGKRCRAGYHLKGTKILTPAVVSDPPLKEGIHLDLRLLLGKEQR